LGSGGERERERERERSSAVLGSDSSKAILFEIHEKGSFIIVA
jgi:hypothetical protein